MLSVVAAVSPARRMCLRAAKQKRNSASAITEQQGAKKKKKKAGMVKEETREGEKLGDKWDTTKSQPNPFYVSVYFILKEIHGK